VLRLLLLTAFTVGSGEGSAALRFDPAGPAFEVTGLARSELMGLEDLKPEAWAEIFAVYVAGASREGGNRPPVLGSYRIIDGGIRFEPRFPPEPGVRYRAVFRPRDARGAPIEQEFLLPKPAAVPARVERLYPSAAQLPENLLKLYLYFSAPMRRGEAYRRVRLFAAGAGREIELPFLELDEELWDREGKRLTLLFDPGRIKRGLRPREEEGPVLEAGKRYALIVDRLWPDASGNPLSEEYRKEFAVGPPDETQPDPKQWKIQPPAAGTRNRLVVTLPEPLDYAMLQRVIDVTGANDARIDGRIAIEAEERRWTFTPERPWLPGEHRLVVEATLEDLAGNSIERPFEVDLFRSVERTSEVMKVRIPFVIQ
jgi:hypothetical protein